MSSPNPAKIIWSRPGEVVRRIAVVGDFLPGDEMLANGIDDWNSAARLLSSYFAEVDLTIGNLECAVGVGSARPRAKLGLGDTFSAGRDSLHYLRELKTGIVGLANNHSGDYGEEGVAATKSALRSAGIAYAGIVEDLQQPPDVCVKELAAGLRIGVWTAARGLQELASRKHPGVEPATKSRGDHAARFLDAKQCSVRIALLHTGLEHTNYPDPADVELMDSLVESGFDVVAACHSHRTSGYRLFERGPNRTSFCFYGLGSIVSPVAYSDLEREGLVVVVGIGADGGAVGVELKPVALTDRGLGYVPADARADVILERVQAVSDSLGDGSFRKHFFADTSKNLLARQCRDAKVAFERGGLRGILGKCLRARPRHLRWLLPQ